MSFHLYQGNQLDVLAALLAGLTAKPEDPFAEETVVVPNAGLGRWLSLEIARRNAICPAIEWIRPGDFIYKYIFNPMQGKRAGFDTSDFTPETTVWEIHALLKSVPPGSERVLAYLKGDELKRWQLAGRLAELFDRYMTYRRDFLDAWEHGRLVTDSPDEPWQAELWRRLTVNRRDTFSALAAEYLANKGAPFAPAKKRFFFFGAATLPEVHLQCALKLAESAEIHFFMFNPCEKLWDDIRSRKQELRDAAARDAASERSVGDFYHFSCNPLLGSMGRSGRDFFLTTLDCAWEHGELSAFNRFLPEESSLLGQMRADIQRNVRRPEPDFKGRTDSVSVHVCHSAMRELEVLRDQLLLAFKELPGLASRDIRVLTPDLATYEPFIEAVFGASESPRIPYRLAGRALAGEYPECAAFLQILNLLDSRFAASAVLSVLTSGPVCARFGLSADDAVQLTALAAKANVAWGLDRQHKASLGGAATDRNSWAAALDRLILGTATADPDPAKPPFETNGRACFPEASAEGSARLIGVLTEAIESLAEARQAAAKPATAPAWAAFLRKLRAAFIPGEETDGAIALDTLIASLEATVGRSRAADEPFGFAVLKSWMTANISTPPGSTDLSSGNVTFSSFSAAGLALPARVVAVIGMNDNAFPHPATTYGFDLMTAKHRLGDPSRRETERYLFLESFLAAKDRFIVTYTGRSERDNNPLPPSILVGELLDAIDLYLPNGRKAVTVEHPLHPFSPRYFTAGGDSRLVTFSAREFRIAKQIASGAKPAAEPATPFAEPATIELDDLVSMLATPPARYVTRVIKASTSIDPVLEPSDAEPLDPPNSLESYNLADDLFYIRFAGGQDGVKQALRNFQVAGDFAPLSPNAVEEHAQGVEHFYDQFIGLIGNTEAEPPATAEFAFGPNKLIARFSDVYRNGAQVLVHPSKQINGKFALKLLVYHLARLASGKPLDRTIGLTKASAFVLSGTDREQARRALESLYLIYKEAATHLLCFDINTFWAVYTGKQPYATSAWADSADAFAKEKFGSELAGDSLDTFDRVAMQLASLFDTFKEGAQHE